MRTAVPVSLLALTFGLAPAAWATPDDPRVIPLSGLHPGAVVQSFPVAQEVPPTTSGTPAAPLGGGLYFDTQVFTPLLQLKTDALTQQQSLGRGLWAGTYDYTHWAIGDSFRFTAQYQGQYLHYFSLPGQRVFFQRLALHMQKQFGLWNWHVGAQGLLKHPTGTNTSPTVLDQLYYMVGERPIGLFGFNLFNIGGFVDYFRAGTVGASYVAPGLVVGYAPPLGDIVGGGIGYRLEYRIGLDGNVSALRHTVNISFAPDWVKVMPVNFNLGVAAQQGQPATFFLSTGLGFSKPLSISQTSGQTTTPGAGEQQTGSTGTLTEAEPPIAAQIPSFTDRWLSILGIPAINPADPTAPGNSAVDPGSGNGRHVDFILR